MKNTFEELNMDYAVWLKRIMRAIHNEFIRNGGKSNNLILQCDSKGMIDFFETTPNMHYLQLGGIDGDAIRCSTDRHDKDYSLYILEPKELLTVLYSLENDYYKADVRNLS